MIHIISVRELLCCWASSGKRELRKQSSPSQLIKSHARASLKKRAHTPLHAICLSKKNSTIQANQSMVEMVTWTVVSPTHQSSNPGACIISGFISGFPAMRFQWVQTFPSTTRRLRWLRKSQDDMPAQSLGGAHRGRMCVCVFIGVSVCACI